MAGDDEEASAVNRPGGVKALLKQLNNKYSDSHVKLPDGTVPTPAKKTFVKPAPARPIRDEQPALRQLQVDSADGGDVSPPKGVRAMLQKEVKSSFVKLPDGSTLKHAPPVAKKVEEAPAPATAASDDDYEPAPLHPPDLNLQVEAEYDDEYDKASRAPPQLLHPAAPPLHYQRPEAMTTSQPQPRAQPHNAPQQPQRRAPGGHPPGGYADQSTPCQPPSPPVLSDYPVQGDTGVRRRGQSPPILSDYPQTSRSVQRQESPPEIVRNGSRSATRGAPPQGHHQGSPPQHGSGYMAGAPGGRHEDNERRGPAGGRGAGGQGMGGHPQPRHAAPHRQREQMRPEDVYNPRTFQNGVHLGHGREPGAREPGREPTRREAKGREKESNRERDVGRDREPMVREREPLAREPRAREPREPMARESRSRDGMGREPMGRDPIGRDGMGHHVLPPAPPALLPGQAPKSSRAGGCVLFDPPASSLLILSLLCSDMLQFRSGASAPTQSLAGRETARVSDSSGTVLTSRLRFTQ